MARLSKEEWQAIRVEREANSTPFRELAAKYGVSDVAIVKRSKAEGWSDGSDGNALANRLAREKAAGISVTIERQKSIVVAADKKAEVLASQQADWALHRELYQVGPDETSDGVNAKRLQAGKLAAEMLKLRHEGERKAHNISDVDVAETGKRDVKAMSDAELEAFLRG
jgi:hypothetical protein